MPSLDARGRFDFFDELKLAEGFKWGGELKILFLSEKILRSQVLN